MAVFEAVGYAKFSGQVGVCVATSGELDRHETLLPAQTVAQSRSPRLVRGSIQLHWAVEKTTHEATTHL
jgi:hypothetical protein